MASSLHDSHFPILTVLHSGRSLAHVWCACMCLSLSLFWHAGVRADVQAHARLPTVLLQAESALEKGQPDRVLALLQAQIHELRRPQHQARGHALICRALYQKQDYRAAELACDAATRLGRHHWSHFNNRGVMRFMLGRYEEAQSDFQEAASSMYSASISQSRMVRRNLAAAKRKTAVDQFRLGKHISRE